MLQNQTLNFLKNLSQNNNKVWFDLHRKEYEIAKKDFEIFIDALLLELSVIEPLFKEQKGKETIFRIFRDVRFAKDKTPYKANFGAYLSRKGKKSPDAGFYLHLQPDGKSFLAGGMWMPENDILKKVRQEIDYNFKEFQTILNKSEFKKLFKEIEGEKLKTVPKGYDADNPAIEYLKLKSFIVRVQMDDKDFTSKTAIQKIVKVFTIMKPLVDFMNRSLD